MAPAPTGAAGAAADPAFNDTPVVADVEGEGASEGEGPSEGDRVVGAADEGAETDDADAGPELAGAPLGTADPMPAVVSPPPQPSASERKKIDARMNHFPRNCGLRFSANAWRPSLRSSLERVL